MDHLLNWDFRLGPDEQKRNKALMCAAHQLSAEHSERGGWKGRLILSPAGPFSAQDLVWGLYIIHSQVHYRHQKTGEKIKLRSFLREKKREYSSGVV